MDIQTAMLAMLIATGGALIAQWRLHRPVIGAFVSTMLFIVGLGPLGWLAMALAPVAWRNK